MIEKSETPSHDKNRGHITVAGEALQKWPNDLYIPPQALQIFLEAFTGPLDLLLYLIRRQNIDILNIPVADIAKQYVAYVEMMRTFRLDLAGEYLVMAAMLAEIKSKMLLPKPIDEEGLEDDPRLALVRRLQTYERFRKAGAAIDELVQQDRDIFVARAEYEKRSTTENLPTISIQELVTAFVNVAARYAQYEHLVVGTETLSVRERMSLIMDQLSTATSIRFEKLFQISEGRKGLVVAFIATLELILEKRIQAVQNDPLSPIHIQLIA